MGPEGVEVEVATHLAGIKVVGRLAVMEELGRLEVMEVVGQLEVIERVGMVPEWSTGGMWRTDKMQDLKGG